MDNTGTQSNDEKYQEFLSNIDPDVAARELAHIAVLRGEMRERETDWARAKAFADGKKDEFHAARSRFELAFDEMLALSTGESKTPLLDRAEQGEPSKALPAAGTSALEALSDDLAKIGYPTDLGKLEAMSEADLTEVRAFYSNVVAFRSASTDPSHSDDNAPQVPAALRGPEEVNAQELPGDGSQTTSPEGETPRQRKRREKKEREAQEAAAAEPAAEEPAAGGEAQEDSHVH